MRYLFADFALDTDCRELLRGADMVAVEPQVFDLLVYLIRHRERVVSKDDLLASVWEGRLVSESALNTRIHLARSAVGDSGETQRLIKTFPRKGIRFVAPVREEQGTAPHGVLTMLAAPTIALLPFTTVGSPELSRAPGATFEAELRSELARTHRGFDLIIRSTADDRDRRLSAKLTGSRPDARYLVVGTLWLDGEVRRANVQLIEADTDRQIWSEPFELKPGQHGASNRFAARIARLIIIQVRTAESRRPLPGQVEAGHYVLQGRALHETERGAKSTSDAQALFNKALQLDPNSVPALQGFAATRLIQFHNLWIAQDQRSAALIEAEAAIERLVKLDPGNASGHYLRASLLRALGDIDKGIASAQHALCLNPNYYAAHAELGRLKIDAGEAHEAMSHIQEAIALIPPEPNAHVLYFWAGLAALHVSDDGAAVLWLLKARQTNPAFSLSPLYLAAAYLGIGEEERARTSLAEFLKITPDFSLAAWRQWFPVPNATVAKQRQRIRDAWHRLGVPGDDAPEQ